MNCKVFFACTTLALAGCVSEGNSQAGNDERAHSSSGHRSGGAFGAGQVVTITGAASDSVDALVLLDGPGRGGVVGRVGNGRLMTVDNCERNWCHVRTTTGQGTAGWIETRHLRAR